MPEKEVLNRTSVTNADKARVERELGYLKRVAEGDPEAIWGWGNPAGRLRAKRRAQFIARGANLRSGIHVLEIGCGTGLFTEMFAQTGARLIAVDLSPEILEKARVRGLPEDQVKFIAARFEECEVEGPFDAVIGSSVLHHLVVDESLHKIFEMLKPGGVLSFAEPNMLNPQIFMERKFTLLRPWVFQFVSPNETAFIRIKLRRQLVDIGFDNVEITPFDWLHPRTPKSLISVVEAFGRLLESLPMVREFSGSLLIQGRRPPRA